MSANTVISKIQCLWKTFLVNWNCCHQQHDEEKAKGLDLVWWLLQSWSLMSLSDHAALYATMHKRTKRNAKRKIQLYNSISDHAALYATMYKRKSAQSKMRNAIAQFGSLSLIAMCIGLNTKLHSANNVLQCIVQIVSSVLTSSWNELSETDQTSMTLFFSLFQWPSSSTAVSISSFKKIGIRQSIKTLLNSMFCWLYINAPILQPVWKGNWLKSSASSHCTSTPVINDHHRPEQSERVFKTNGCGGQSQSKDSCLWNQINCSAPTPLLLLNILTTTISFFCDN